MNKGHSASCFIYGYVSSDQKKRKILLATYETLLYGNNCNYGFRKFSQKYVFIPFLPFMKTRKQEPNFLQLGDLIIKMFFVHSEPRSTSKVCRIQQTFLQGFTYIFLFLFMLLFHGSNNWDSTTNRFMIDFYGEKKHFNQYKTLLCNCSSWGNASNFITNGKKLRIFI